MSAVGRVVGFGGAAATLVAVATAVPLPEYLLWTAVTAASVAGVPVGALVGRLADGGRRSRLRAGVPVGLLLGGAVAVAVLATMTLVVRHPDGSVLYGWHLLLAKSGALPPEIAARYDRLIAAGYAGAVGALLAGETVVAAVVDDRPAGATRTDRR